MGCGEGGLEFESDGLLHDRAGGHDATCLTCPTATTDPRGAVNYFAGDSYYIGCDFNMSGQTAWWTALTQAEIAADMAQ